MLGRGMVITVVVGDRTYRNNAIGCFCYVHRAIIRLLKETAGISNIETSGISDLSINGRKILGSSLYMGTRPPLFYYQSSLLVSSDNSIFNHYLYHPPREPDYRQHRSHSEFCTSLKQEGYMISAKKIVSVFSKHLAGCIANG